MLGWTYSKVIDLSTIKLLLKKKQNYIDQQLFCHNIDKNLVLPIFKPLHIDKAIIPFDIWNHTKGKCTHTSLSKLV